MSKPGYTLFGKCMFGIFCLLPLLLNAAVIYVNPAAAGANNGTSWINAFTSLDVALLQANSGDEIWVAKGVYKPLTQTDANGSGGADPREAAFRIPDGVKMFGGFSGTELSTGERNWELNKTILSGDLEGNDVNGDGNFIAEAVTDVMGNNAYHVLYTENAGAGTGIDGFVVTAGRAEFAGVITDPNQDGGAWYNRLSGVLNASSPFIRNTVFQGNYAASEGGALYNSNAAAGAVVLSLIENCKFIANKSNVNGGAISIGSFSAGNYQPNIVDCIFLMNEAYRRGGAIYAVGDHMKIDSCLFRENKVTAVSPDGSTLPGSGGALALTASGAAFIHCIFDGNSATGNPTGAFEGGGGGAVYISTSELQTNTLGISQPRFTGCGFYNNSAAGNTAAWGGAVTHLNDGGKLRPAYINCVFSNNQAQDDGGAVASFTRVISVADDFVPDLRPAFTNCTFTANQAGERGGALFNDGYLYKGTEVLHARVENSILWNNTAASGAEVFHSGINTVVYSLVKGCGGSGGGWNNTIGTDGGHNLDADPAFTQEADPDGTDNIPGNHDDGLRLLSASPGIDAGNNAAAGLAGISTDFRKSTRINGVKVDMGAYEYSGVIIPDLDIYWLKDWKLYNPLCLSCPWAFLLADKILQHFIWETPAQFLDSGKTAAITGRIVHPRNKSMGFDVYIKLVNKQDWKSWNAQGRTYNAFTPEAIQVAKKMHKTWMFWELSKESYLEGTGELSGRVRLAHFPVNYKTGFQSGEGANAWDKDPGVSGSFSYEGKLIHRGKKINVKGLGSMNVDAEPCKRPCPSITMYPVVKKGEESTEISVSSGLVLYPIPAGEQLHILSESLLPGKYTLRLYDNTGRLRKEEILDTANGNFILQLHQLQSGVYVLQLISDSGEIISRKMIRE